LFISSLFLEKNRKKTAKKRSNICKSD